MWNPKARLWVNGREDFFSRNASTGFDKNDQVAWMHCASLGEFEQGRPLLEALRIAYPNVKLVLTFFSSSGYEVMKDHTGVDRVYYLPTDSISNARKFIAMINPSLVLWVKYEFWYHYLTTLKENKVPVLLVSGIFRSNMPFFRSYGGLWRSMLQGFAHLFVQNQGSKELIETVVKDMGVTVCGDTRYDRVIGIAKNFSHIPGIKDFCGDHPVIVAGSTWEEDEVELLHYVKINPETRFIIAPHEVDEENLADVKKEFPGARFYSELTDTTLPDTNVLIIDNVGMLTRLYHYATISLIGGGFGADGVHNVLEAAVYGKPVLFGPVYERYDEAIGLVEAGGAESIDGPLGLEKVLRELMQDDQKRKMMGDSARQFVYENKGATEAICRFIQEKRLLTS